MAFEFCCVIKKRLVASLNDIFENLLNLFLSLVFQIKIIGLPLCEPLLKFWILLTPLINLHGFASLARSMSAPRATSFFSRVS